jgi:intracellular septation protein A
MVFSLIFMLGIIWRVEKKLDISYKIFFVGLVCLFLAKGAELLEGYAWLQLASKILNLLFAIFFLSGIWVLRNMLQHLDGEKEEEK